jgi:hypothetical protein
MNCYNHPDVSAIGTCKACSKGLCKDCVTDLDHGLACKNKHETEVENINMIISKNTRIYSSASQNTIIAPMFYLFMGLLFAGFGYTSKGGVTDLPFMLGIGFIIFGIVNFVRNRAIFGKKT